MNRNRIKVAAFLGLVCFMGLPNTVAAQYRCAVSIELKGKTVLAGQIRDTERPSTAILWETLQTLSFTQAANGNDLPDPKSVEKATLKGKVLVKVNGAGQVELDEINLVPNKFDAKAWVIAPADFARIIKLRDTSKDEQPKK